MKVTQLVTLIVSLAVTAAGCVGHGQNLPPASRLLEPGPGVGGPGPGVLPPPGVDGRSPAAPGAPAGQLSGVAHAPGVEAACRGCPTCSPSSGAAQIGYNGPSRMNDGGGMVMQRTVQVLFAAPESMQVRWDVTGQNNFDSEPLVVPGRQNFSQSGVYRLKLTNIKGFEGVELYPTLEVGPVTPRTRSFLAHSAIPVQFTQDDFSQVMAGNHVVKVIYLPDPEFQVLAVAGGVGTLVSTKLDPGQDPIVEADQRGAIMGILRIGNLDIEALSAAGEPAFIGGEIAGGAGLGGAAAYGGGYGGGPAASWPAGHIAGVTTSNYGMPWVGTPIGLPGPAHIPHGSKAGLQKHVMWDNTHKHIPQPVSRIGMHVKQEPGYSYPAPPNKVRIREQNIAPSYPYRQPGWDKRMLVR